MMHHKFKFRGCEVYGFALGTDKGAIVGLMTNGVGTMKQVRNLLTAMCARLEECGLIFTVKTQENVTSPVVTSKNFKTMDEAEAMLASVMLVCAVGDGND